MLRIITVCSTIVLSSTLSSAALVWQSTFNSDTDGVVDVVDKNLTKTLIGPVAGGKIQITTEDRVGAHNNNDRGGRALGSTVNGHASYSGLYEFQWSQLNELSTPVVWESVGFIGNADNITRQIAGVMLRHWKVGENYYTSLDMNWGEAGRGQHIFNASGAGGFGTYSPTAVLLGANATSSTFKLAIGYDGASHVLTAALYNADGELMSGNQIDLDTAMVPNGSFTQADMLNALALTHLGWADYTATGGNRTTTWQVDTLSYFNTADGAFEAAVVPEPASSALMLAGVMVLARRRR